MAEETQAAAEQPQTTETAAPAPAAPTGPNFVLTYRREHPGNRCSYGIQGNSGIVVFDKGLFVGGDQPGFTAPPVITLDCQMVPIKLDNKTAKAEEQARKLAERAEKAKAKIEAAQAKAAEKAKKAEEALKAAQAKVAAAQAGAAPAADGGATQS